MSFNLERLFTNREVLRSITGENLHSLLAGHEKALTTEGFVLPDDPNGPIDYDALAELLMEPEKLPPDLRDAFFFINEMATEEGMELLLDAAEQSGLKILGGQKQTPSDVAVQVWLKNRSLLERKHAEQFIHNPRTFECFHTPVNPVPAHRRLSAEQIGAMVKDLNDWFEKKKKGRSVKLFFYKRPDGIWFLVRHGDPFKREGAIDDNNESIGVYYWPEKFDVLILDPESGELRMTAKTKGTIKLYRTIFGRHLYGDDGFFGGEDKYTLEPLGEKGEDAVACSDVDGMEEALLTEMHLMRGGSFHEREIRKASDIFAAFKARSREFPKKVPIVKAGFRVRFSDSDTPRTVIIKPPNVAQYTRDDDSRVIEKWLKLRGFIRHKGKNK